MPNHAYERGRTWEYDVMAFLRSKGWTVIRSAGSHQAIDLIAGRYKFLAHRRTLAIQCKTNNAHFSKKDKEAVILAAREFGAVPMLAERRGRMRTYWVLSDGNNDIIVNEATYGSFFD